MRYARTVRFIYPIGISRPGWSSPLGATCLTSNNQIINKRAYAIRPYNVFHLSNRHSGLDDQAPAGRYICSKGHITKYSPSGATCLQEPLRGSILVTRRQKIKSPTAELQSLQRLQFCGRGLFHFTILSTNIKLLWSFFHRGRGSSLEGRHVRLHIA